MLTFLQFLNEGDQKYLYGVNHTDRDAPFQIIKLARLLGYEISQQRGGHIQIHHPETGEHVSVVSMGTGGLKRHRDALKQIHDHQMSIDGFSGFDHTIQTIKKELRQRDVMPNDTEIRLTDMERQVPDIKKPDKGREWFDRWRSQNPDLNT